MSVWSEGLIMLYCPVVYDGFVTFIYTGMEGSPVFDEQAQFVGLLTRPLRQKISGTEIQVCQRNMTFKCWCWFYLI